MKLAKKIAALLVMMITAPYQGRRQFERVVSLSKKAKELDPESYFAFLMLGDDLIRLKRYDEAEEVLKEAIYLYPDSSQFSELMVNLLYESQAPVGIAIVHIKSYFKNREPVKSKIPLLIKYILKILKPSFNLEAYAKELDNNQAEWEKWAEEILKSFEAEDKD